MNSTNTAMRWLAVVGVIGALAAGCGQRSKPTAVRSLAPPSTTTTVHRPPTTTSTVPATTAPRPTPPASSSSSSASSPRFATAAAAPAAAAPARGITVPASSQIATLRGDTARYPYPGAASDGTIPGTWYGYPSALPVIDQAPGWVEVRTAQRPNMFVTWVRTRDVDLAPTIYHLVLDLSTEHLMVFQSGQLVSSFPAGIGAPDAPTPNGTFFVAFKAPPPNAGYGPFVLVTSAHSNAINDWEGMGDAVTGIHGPITSGADAQIGSSGARISHGCVRLHDDDLLQLAGIPGGTPLDIVY